MSIASRITSIEGHISDIYDSVELTGVDTTDIDKNLVNVPNTLKEGYIDIINNGTDTLYNNFPKVSGEGTSLTLNNTYQAPMRNNLKGNTSQTGTPTPTNPIPVNAVSGDNKITINSKNQLETYNISGTYNGVSYTLQDGVLTLNGTCTASGAFTGLGIFRQSKGINYKWTYVYESGSCTDYGGGLFMGATPTSTTSAGYGAGFRVSQSRTVGTFNNGEEHIYYLYITLNTNSTYTNYKVKPLIVQGNDYSYDFEPYQGNTYNIDLPVENLVDTLATNTSITGSGLSYSRSEDGTISVSGTSTRAYDYTLTTSYTFKAGETYTFYCERGGTIGVNYYMLFSANNGGQLTFSISNPSPITRTMVEDQTIPVKWSLGNNTQVNYSVRFMIQKGTKASPYTPYGSAIELCKIGNYQDQFKKATGKNLAPINLESETYNSLQITNNNNGTFTLLGNPTGSFGRDIATNLTLKAGTYTISANAMPSGLYIALDNTTETQLSNGTLSKTFTLASDTTYTSLGIWFTKNKDYDVTIQLQIEKSGSATEWQPKEGWYLHKEIKKLVLNGSESFPLSKNTSPYVFTYVVDDYKYVAERIIYCNYFEGTTNGIIGTMVNGETHFRYYTDGTFGLYFCTADYSNTADFTNWVSTHNIIAYYVLETPTSEGIPTNLINQLEELYIAKSKENQTNISQVNNNLPFIISASALKKG